MKKFPFPSKEVAFDELKSDPMYKKLLRSGIDTEAAVEKAWSTGTNTARSFFQETGAETDFGAIAARMGLPVRRSAMDNVVAGRRYFSEYLSNKKEMILYMGSIGKWADSNEMTIDEAVNLILSHEIYHHLENTRIGFTSKQISVPMLEIFGFKIGTTGVRALSEIGAHAFARTYYELANRNKPHE